MAEQDGRNDEVDEERQVADEGRDDAESRAEGEEETQAADQGRDDAESRAEGEEETQAADEERDDAESRAEGDDAEEGDDRDAEDTTSRPQGDEASPASEDADDAASREDAAQPEEADAQSEADAPSQDAEVESSDQEGGQGAGRSSGKQAPRKPPGGMELAATARRILAQATGRHPESVTGVRRDGDVWEVTMDVVELERIPSSTDVIAEYVVELDGDGELVGYRRTARFHRSQAGGRDG
jgi:hypothetical protein